MKHEIIGGALSLPNGTALPLSKAARAGDFVFLSGQLSLNAQGQLVGAEIEAQTRQCLENIKTLLSESGCGLENVVKATVWLVDPKDFAGFNKIYAEYFPNNPPTRSAVCTSLVLADALVEIEVLAYSPRL